MIVSLLKKDADLSMATDNEDKALKSTYQCNKNFILGQVFRNIIYLLTKTKHKQLLKLWKRL